MLFRWDYAADFSDFGYFTPYPSWNFLSTNIRTLATAGGGSVKGIFTEGDDTSLYGDLQELRSYIIARTAWDPTAATGPTYKSLLSEFLPGFYGAAAAPHINAYIEQMTASVAEHGTIGPRKWEGRQPGIFTSICAAYLTPAVVLQAGATLKAASAAAVAAAYVPGGGPKHRFIDRVARAQLPIYLAVLGRWTEIYDFGHNTSRLGAWPFEDTLAAAFNTFDTIMNTTDPAGLPTSDYYQSGKLHTMDDSAETTAVVWHLITAGGSALPHGATPMCSP